MTPALKQLGLVLWAIIAVRTARAAEPFSFEDVTESSGLAAQFENVPGKRPWRSAHGAAWGDVDGDGRPDLFAGAFAARKWFTGDDAPIPNLLLLNQKAGFVRADVEPLDARAANSRCAGAAFLDLDNDGDLDLVVANHVQKADHGGSRLFENQGAGKWKDVTPNETLPLKAGGRGDKKQQLDPTAGRSSARQVCCSPRRPPCNSPIASRC